jgi:hypothetical protein
MNLKLTVNLPPAAEERLRAESPDLPAAVREGFLVNLFRRGILSHAELGDALGLDGVETDALLKRHQVSEQALTHGAVDDNASGDVRLEREHVPSRAFVLGPESEEELLEETLVAWQSQGPAAAWQAMFDLLGPWFEARGRAPEQERVVRTHIEVHRVPWSLAERGDDA